MKANKMKSKKMNKSAPAPSKQDAPKVPTLTKEKSRYEFSNRITGSDTGKIDPSKHTEKQ